MVETKNERVKKAALQRLSIQSAIMYCLSEKDYYLKNGGTFLFRGELIKYAFRIVCHDTRPKRSGQIHVKVHLETTSWQHVGPVSEI